MRFTKADSTIIDEEDGLCATSFYEEIFLFSAIEAHKKAEPNEPGLLNRGNVRFRNSLFFAPLLWLYLNLSFGLVLLRDEPDIFVTLTIFKLQRGLPGKVLQH